MGSIDNRRGATIVLVAAALAGLLSVLALAIDVGMLFTARGEAQRVADAAALAGAGSFIVAPDNGPRARAVAIDYAGRNDVRNQPVTLREEDVVVDLANERVTVTVRRTAESGGAIGTWFARLFGVDAVDVGATATAEAVPAGAATCLKPFAVPDLWDDVDDNGRYDPGETYDPTTTGYGSDFRDGVPSNNQVDPVGTTYENDFGRPVVLKEGTPQEAIVPSWYFPWDVPQVDGQPTTGASRYRWNISKCNTSIVHLGEEYMVETGNMTGPTKQGVEGLVDLDPDAQWDVSADSVVGSAFEPWEGSPRVIEIPLFDPTEPVDPGKKPIEFNNITSFFVEGMRGKDVVGRFMFASGIGVGSDGTGGEAVAPELKFVRLIE